MSFLSVSCLFLRPLGGRATPAVFVFSLWMPPSSSFSSSSSSSLRSGSHQNMTSHIVVSGWTKYEVETQQTATETNHHRNHHGSLPLVPVLCVVRLLIVWLSVPRRPLPPRPSDPAVPLSGHSSGVFLFHDSLKCYRTVFVTVKPLEAWGEHQDGDGHKQAAVQGDIFPRFFHLAQVLDGQGSVQRCCGKEWNISNNGQWWRRMWQTHGFWQSSAPWLKFWPLLSDAVEPNPVREQRWGLATMWIGTGGNFFFLYWPLWVSF